MNERGLAEVRVMAERFRQSLEARGYAARSVGGYMDRLRVYVGYLGSEDRTEDIRGVTKEGLRRYQMYLYERRGSDGRGWCLRTQSGLLTAARMFFRYLVQRGDLASDPSSGLELPKEVETLPRGVLTVGEMRRLLNAPDVDTARGLRDRAMLELFYATGMRCMELANLLVTDVDVERGEARIRRGKGGKERVVPVGEVAGRVVGEYARSGRPYFVERRRVYLAGVGAAGRPALERENTLLFLGERGRKISSMMVSKLVRGYARRAGIGKAVTSHGIRHTCATHMLKGGASLRHIQELLGHGSLETTQIYTHVAVTDLKREHRRCHPRERCVG